VHNTQPRGLHAVRGETQHTFALATWHQTDMQTIEVEATDGDLLHRSPEDYTVRIIARLVLRHRARQSVLNALRFAERLRRQNSEFAPTYADTINNIGDELATMSREACRDAAERRALLAGLLSAFQRMYRSNPALAQSIARRLAPRILATEHNHDPATAAMKIAF